MVACVLAVVLAMEIETAQRASDFVNSIGVNVHLSYWNGPYGKNFPTVAALLEASGIKHVRDGLALGQTPVCSEVRNLSRFGIRFTYITQPDRTRDDLISWAGCTGPGLEAFEAPNEYDISHPSSEHEWAETLQSFQKNLYTWVKTTPALSAIAVIGPSLTSKAAYDSVGDLSKYLDFGNTHDYFAGHEPETAGWGFGGYGSIGYNIDVAKAVSKNKPILATETGYGTGNSDGNVTERVQAAYVPRMFLEQFAAGIRRTDEYELVDEGGAPFDHMGLVRGDLQPKPAYLALKAMIGLIKDDGTFEDEARIPLEIDGDPNPIHHVLLQKASGACLLALWKATSSVEPQTRLEGPQAVQSVRVTTGAGWKMTQLYMYDARFSLQRSDITGSSSRIPVGQDVTFVELADASQ